MRGDLFSASLIDGSGSTTPPCDHAWTETNTTPATCTVPGSKLSACSKCQQTKKDSIPALGHDWQVKQTVTTEYDDTGQLTQEGYTIFECSRCKEQYKSPDGTIPPGGGSGTDPGGDEGETIWDKLGKLLGTAVKALLDLLGSAVDVILGGLIDLIGCQGLERSGKQKIFQALRNLENFLRPLTANCYCATAPAHGRGSLFLSSPPCGL